MASASTPVRTMTTTFSAAWPAVATRRITPTMRARTLFMTLTSSSQGSGGRPPTLLGGSAALRVWCKTPGNTPRPCERGGLRRRIRIRKLVLKVVRHLFCPVGYSHWIISTRDAGRTREPHDRRHHSFTISLAVLPCQGKWSNLVEEDNFAHFRLHSAERSRIQRTMPRLIAAQRRARIVELVNRRGILS